jgi:predicted phage replisome organizer
MGEIKWIKMCIGMHDDEKMKLLDSLVNRDTAHYVWIRLLVQAGKTNAKGKIFLSEGIPYTKEMLSIIFNRPIELIESSLKILSDLKMIDIDENNIINILNWEKHQNIEGMEKIREQTRKRVNKYREKEKAEKNNANEENQGESHENNNDGGNDSANNKHINIEDEEIQKNTDEKGNPTHIHSMDKFTEQSIKFGCSRNVIVTEQNKTENKNKIKRKIENKTELEMDMENKAESDNDIENNTDSFLMDEKNIEKDKMNEVDIIEYIKKSYGKIKGCNLNTIKAAICTHGVENVKLAIDKALEVNRPRMNYINGILNNWQTEGYPPNYSNTSKSSSNYEAKNHKVLNFNNFEPRNYDYKKLEEALLGWE